MKKAFIVTLISFHLLFTIKASSQSILGDSTSITLFPHLPLSAQFPKSTINLFPLSNYEEVNASNNIVQFNKVLQVYLSTAVGYLKVSEFEKAEKMILRNAMPLSFAYGDDKSNYSCFMNIGKSYFAQRKFTEAKWFFIQANTTSKKMNNKNAELASLMEMAKVKKTIGDKKLALKDYIEAQKLAIKLKSTFNADLAKANITALN